MQFDVRLPPMPVGGDFYYQLYQSKINGHGFYFGLQSSMARPGQGFVGPGMIFSRFGERNTANLDVPAGGFIENGDHEGGFIGVRQYYRWTANQVYTVRLERQDSALPGTDWFQLKIGPKGGNLRWVGGIRFPRIGASPAAIDQTGGTWTELYRMHSGARSVSSGNVPTSFFEATLTSPAAVRSSLAYSELPNTNTFWDAAVNRFRLNFGGSNRRCVAPGAGPLP